MPLDPTSLYYQLGRLVESAPDLEAWPLSSDSQRWLGKAVVLVEQSRNLSDVVSMKNHITQLGTAARSYNAQNILIILYRALAIAELNAPASDQGAFIPAGSSFDAMIAVGKVLKQATSDLLIVDPYMNEKTLTDFALLVPEGMPIRLLSDEQFHKASVRPAVIRWVSQYGADRPLEMRLAAARSLHDRLIVVDGTIAWVLTPSLNGFASRSPASIVRSDPETASLKIAAYQDIWATAAQIAA